MRGRRWAALQAKGNTFEKVSFSLSVRIKGRRVGLE